VDVVAGDTAPSAAPAPGYKSHSRAAVSVSNTATSTVRASAQQVPPAAQLAHVVGPVKAAPVLGKPKPFRPPFRVPAATAPAATATATATGRASAASIQERYRGVGVTTADGTAAAPAPAGGVSAAGGGAFDSRYAGVAGSAGNGRYSVGDEELDDMWADDEAEEEVKVPAPTSAFATSFAPALEQEQEHELVCAAGTAAAADPWGSWSPESPPHQHHHHQQQAPVIAAPPPAAAAAASAPAAGAVDDFLWGF